MFRRRNRDDRWRGLSAVGRAGFALAGGALFGFLAWQPRADQDTSAPPRGENRLTAADGRSANAALPNPFNRHRGPGSQGVATIKPKERPEASEARVDAALDSANNQRGSVATITEVSGKSNPLASPRGPP